MTGVRRLKVSFQGIAALMALLGVPVTGITAVGTVPSFFLFFDPGIDAYFPQVTDIVQDFTVMGVFIIVEIGELLAGKIITLGAVG